MYRTIHDTTHKARQTTPSHVSLALYCTETKKREAKPAAREETDSGTPKTEVKVRMYIAYRAAEATAVRLPDYLYLVVHTCTVIAEQQASAHEMRPMIAFHLRFHYVYTYIYIFR